MKIAQRTKKMKNYGCSMGLINWCWFFFISVVKFEPKSGKQLKTKSKTKSYTQCFAESLVVEGQRDEKIVAIHAAMWEGTGLNLFQKHFPERCFDVESKLFNSSYIFN